MDYSALELLAQKHGFTYTAPLDPKTIDVKMEVRQMCEANTCGRYNKCWSCPPGCGSLEEHRERVAGYNIGILVQTVGELEDNLDFEAMMDTEAAHKKHFLEFYAELRKLYPGMLALGSGSCTQCKPCAYPDAPCRFPEKMVSSMEAYGMLVTEVCKANNMRYNYGPCTIAYTSCYLLE